MATVEEFRQDMMAYNVLDPVITYDGDFTFQPLRDHFYHGKEDILALNSKIDKNGNNMYLNLMHSYFYNTVNLDRLGSLPDGIIFPLLVSSMDEEGKHRVLRYSYIFTVCNLTEDKDALSNGTDVEVLCENARDWYKEQRRIIKEYKSLRLASPYTEVVLRRFCATPGFIRANGPLTVEEIMANKETIDKKITDEWLDGTANKFTDVIVTLRHIKDYTSEKRNLPQDKFMDCFDEDVFLLMIMKVIIDNQASSIRMIGAPDNCLVEVAQYLATLERAKLRGYNPVIKYYDRGSREVKKYTVKDLKRDYERLVTKYKDKIRNYELTSDQVERLGLDHDIEAMDKFRELIKEDDENIIKADWDILSPGEKEETIAAPRRTNSSNSSETTKKRIDEDEILYRRYIFQQTEYLKQIVGREKFKGYVGYIYENGLVIFEKFYEEGGKVAQMQATYVMNYKNFIEFTQLTKPEILEYIKNTDNQDVMRLYHTKNWADRLASVIGSVDKTMESQVFVETLASGDVRTRKRSDN